MTNTDGTDIMTSREVAEYLRLPITTVYKLASEKGIPAFRAGKHWRFRRTDIEEWINIQSKQAKDQAALDNS